ncbi:MULTISPECIES: hypothetical protein [Janthinobacterium]|uniref:Uncharacterized protein n=1 Tax=Janthinobacterium kumbetense TaxID=2950280 RepID=A0ABT0WYP8_9BURK|nr:MULTISPECIES: hypothetical protein [Janthinobacterium]MCM2568472.1 hypothetical protein [Janthinobacterium kumbetense]MDN2680735.1 hypothetical protein [Janthinobacterium sp. SUN033]
MGKAAMAAMAALVWGIGLAAQAAPLRLPAGKEPVAQGGSVTAVAQGALIRYRGWLLAIDGAVPEERPDIVLTSADARHAPLLQIGATQRTLPLWSAFELVKGSARLRITALPGLEALPALLLDFGESDYRIVIPAAPIERQAYPLLAQRFPGADLALLLQDGRRVMLPLGSSSAQVFGAEQAVPYRFTKVKR